MNGSGITAVVLAGSRGGGDAVAAAAGVSHKALAPVAGRAMLLRVLDTLRAVPRIHRIIVVIDPPDALGPMEGVAIWPPGPSPCASLLGVLDRMEDGDYPLLVTTADHPLLTPQMVEWFWAHLPPDCDAAAAAARAETIRAAHPESRRTYLRFSDGWFSGCNLFALATPAARDTVERWRRIEGQRKRPWRMARLLGLKSLMAFAFGRLSLADALTRLGPRLAVVEMPFAEAAIDVDRPDDLRLAETLLSRRART